MKKATLLLIAFLVVGFAIRVYEITRVSMYGDELTLVYDTYSIIKTGRDQTGKFLPITFPMRGRTPGGYVYFSIPAVFLLGPTILAVRVLSLASGLGIIILCYFLGKRLFNEKVALLAAFITAISPWDIYLSRGGFEAHFALFLGLLGVVSFLYAKDKNWLYVLWAISWGLAIHTYPTFELTLPLIFLIILWYTGNFWKVIKNKIFIVAVVILVFFGAVSIREAFLSNSQERFLSLNIFANQGLEQSIVQLINSEREMSTLPEPLKFVYFNKPFEYTRTLFENYMKNISFDFLFLRGDGNPRHNPGEFGMFYLVDLPLVFFGTFLLWVKRRKDLVFLMLWILVVPLATMFLPEAHGLRNSLMIPPFVMLISFALSTLSRSKFLLCISLMLIQLVFILGRVYFLAPTKFATFWSAEARNASLTAIATSSTGKAVVLSTKIDNIEYAYPVYAKIDPNLVITQFGKFPKKYGNVVITDSK